MSDTETSISVKVLEIKGLKAWSLRVPGPATPENIGLAQARLLRACAHLPALGSAFGLDYGEGGYAACRPASSEFPLPHGLEVVDFRGGWYAVSIHRGGYDTLGTTLRNVLAHWLPHGGFARREAALLYRYLTDPRETSEADARTEVCVPVRPDPIE